MMTWLQMYTNSEVMSMNILHLDSSILGEGSVSRQLSSAVVNHLQSETEAQVTYRDLVAQPIPHLSPAYLTAGGTPEELKGEELREDLALGAKVLEEFLVADVVVLGVAFYNFTVSTQLKAWIDRIAVAGKTFRYDETGPHGLCGDKRVILAISRGGFYGSGTGMETFEHAETYLRSVFGFLGVTNVEVVAAEGINLGPDQREKSVASALQSVRSLQAA